MMMMKTMMLLLTLMMLVMGNCGNYGDEDDDDKLKTLRQQQWQWWQWQIHNLCIKFRVGDGNVEGNQMVMTLSFRLSVCEKNNWREIVSFLDGYFTILNYFCRKMTSTWFHKMTPHTRYVKVFKVHVLSEREWVKELLKNSNTTHKWEKAEERKGNVTILFSTTLNLSWHYDYLNPSW